MVDCLLKTALHPEVEQSDSVVGVLAVLIRNDVLETAGNDHAARSRFKSRLKLLLRQLDETVGRAGIFVTMGIVERQRLTK